MQELLGRAYGMGASASAAEFPGIGRNGFLVFGGAFDSRDSPKICLFNDDPLHLGVSSDSDLDLPEDLGN
jgi:hypothetical protein